MKVVHFYSLLLFLSCFFLSTQNGSAEPTADELWDNIQLVHVTHIIKQSTVVPGATKIIRSGRNDVVDIVFHALKTFIENQKSTPDKAPTILPAPFLLEEIHPGEAVRITDLQGTLVNPRITTHWSVHQAIPNKTMETKTNSMSFFTRSLWSQAKIGIIEKARHFKGQLWGGFHKDFIVVGPHRLSRDSFIIAPAGMEKALLADNPGFPGTMIFYDDSKFPNAGEALEHLRTKNPALSPLRWAIRLNKQVEVMTDEEKYALFEEYRRLPKSGNGDFDSRLSAIIAEARESEKFPSQLKDLLLLGERNPATSLIYVDQKAVYGRSFFQAWEKAERFPWTLHSTSVFYELERVLTTVFNRRDALLLLANVSQSIEEGRHFYRRSEEELKKISKIDQLTVSQALGEARQTMGHLNKGTMKHFQKFENTIMGLFGESKQ